MGGCPLLCAEAVTCGPTTVNTPLYPSIMGAVTFLAVIRAVRAVARGIGRALRARPGAIALTVAGVLALDVFLPPLLLSVARKPWTVTV